MKGIVVEISGKTAVILTENGLFNEVRNQDYGIGQAIDIKEEKRVFSKLAAGAAGLAAAFALCTMGAYSYYTPTDYVSLDVNPSVVYTVNRFDRILDADAANDDGSKILTELRLNNKTLDAAIKETLEKLMAEGYLGDDPDGGVVITTSNKKKAEAEKLAAKLEKEVRSYLKEREGVTSQVKAEAVKPEQVAEAKELGVSAGKLNLVEKLQASTSGAIDRDEWLSVSVKDINKAIRENRKTWNYYHENNNDKAFRRDSQEDGPKGGSEERAGADAWNDRGNSWKNQEETAGWQNNGKRSSENKDTENRNNSGWSEKRYSNGKNGERRSGNQNTDSNDNDRGGDGNDGRRRGSDHDQSGKTDSDKDSDKNSWNKKSSDGKNKRKEDD